VKLASFHTEKSSTLTTQAIRTFISSKCSICVCKIKQTKNCISEFFFHDI